MADFNLKILGLILGAVLALSAVGASGAAAAEFHAASAPVEFTGTQTTTHVFKFRAGNVTCTQASFVGSQATTTSASLKLAPTYANCKFLGLATSIDMNGCTYIYTTTSATAGQMSISCPEGKAIVVTGLNCTVTVGAQGPLNKVSYATTGTSPNRDVDIDHLVTELKYTLSGTGCLGGTGTFTDGTYTGSTTVKGENPTSKTSIEVWVA